MMSLRAEIRDALDDVIPPDPTLERDVMAYVLADERERRMLTRKVRRSPWANRFQGSVALVAAALVVLLIAGLILGGRFLRDRGTSPAPAVNQTELKKLEARPLAPLLAMPSDGVCPVGPLADDFRGIGNGVVRSVTGNPSVYRSTWGTWSLLAFAVDPTARGLFLVRARDLRSGETVYFAGNLSGVADANIGRAILAGDVAGDDRVNGLDVPLRPELVIDASRPHDFEGAKKAPTWSAYVGYPKSGTGCTFFQVDYLSSNQPETFVRSL